MATKTVKKAKPEKPAEPEATPTPAKAPEVKFHEVFTVAKDASGHQVKAGEAVVKTFKTEKAAASLKDWLNCGYTAFRQEQDAKKTK